MSPLLLAFAVSVAAPGFEDLDAGPSADALADVAWVGDGRVQAVWFNARRDLAFRMDRRRGADLWTNQTLPDGGLLRPQGEILCPTAPNEFFSSPRIASNRAQTWVAWKVTLSDRDVLRASEVDAFGRIDCAGNLYDPGPGGRFSGLQLEEAAGTFMTVFENATQILALPLNGASTTPVEVHLKNTSTGATARHDPSLGPRLGGGFTVAWQENGVLTVADIDTRGQLQLSYNAQWSGILLSAGPLALGPPVRIAAVGTGAGDTGPVVKVGLASAAPASGPDNITKIIASIEGTNMANPSETRVRVFGRTQTTWSFTDFTPTAGVSGLLPQGVEPLAVTTAFNRAMLLTETLGEHGFMPFVGPSISGMSSTLATRTDTSQLLPSVLWVDGGVFAVGFMEGAALRAGSVNPNMPQQITGVNTWSNDGGVYRFHPRSSGPGIAVSVQSSQGSTLALTTFAQGQLTSANPILSSALPGLDEAVVGENLSLFWARGGTSYVAGSLSAPSSFSAPTVRMGRCGVKVGNQLLAPYVNGPDLKLISLLDQPGELPISRSVRTDALGVEPPCLAASGRELLIVADDASGNLRVWKTSVDDVLLNRAATEVPVPLQPATRGVKNPVALGMPWGWQLAWESTDPYGNQIVETTLFPDGGTGQGSIVSSGLDGRQPLLASAPTGEILVVWQQYVEALGAVLIRSQRVDRLVWLPDGGIADAGVVTQPDASVTFDAGTPDAGLTSDGGLPIDDGGVVFDGGVPMDAGLITDGGAIDDGGLATDAGTTLDGGAGDAGIAGPSPDGGLSSEPLRFSTCGCGPSGDPALALLGALLFFAARRRRSS